MIFVISAPSGAGKTTLINRLIGSDDRFMFSVSTTTRSKRAEEIDGVNYDFVDEEDFLSKIEHDDFLEWAYVYGHYYGTRKKEVDRIVGEGKFPIFDVDIQGSRLLRAKLEDAVFIFIIPPSREVLKERLTGRQSDSSEQIDLRLENAGKEIAEYKHFDYIIVNDNIDSAFAGLKAIIQAESCRKDNIEPKISSILEEFNDYTT